MGFKQLRVSVVGTGYLGATHATCLAQLGHEVVGVDVDAHKIDALAGGELPFSEPGLPELLRQNLDAGRLRFTTSFADAAKSADLHFICVGTPQRAGSYDCDTTYVESAFAELASYLDHSALIVGKSTVPVGTAARMAALVGRSAPVGTRVEVAWNPEFLREGHGVQDTLAPDRLVLGVESSWAERMLRLVYQPVIENGTPVLVTDFPTAELVKTAANAFLATKISFINAMAELCEAADADVRELAWALGKDTRIGERFLGPGLGYGGGCLPKDLRALIARGRELGVGEALGFLEEVDGVNQRRRERVVRLGQELLGDYAGTRVCVLGASFKPETDDIRDSPAMAVALAVQARGADVAVYDPEAGAVVRRTHPQLGVFDSAVEAAQDADLVLVLCDWAEFRRMDPAVLSPVVRRPAVIDARHVLDPAQWRAAGWQYRA